MPLWEALPPATGLSLQFLSAFTALELQAGRADLSTAWKLQVQFLRKAQSSPHQLLLSDQTWETEDLFSLHPLLSPKWGQALTLRNSGY